MPQAQHRVAGVGVRSLASPGTVRLLTGLALLLALAVGGAMTSVARATPIQQVSFRLGEQATGHRIFRVTGTETRPGQFDFWARIWRLPCRGAYMFTASGEKLATNRHDRYQALLRVTPESAAARRAGCGARLGRRAGRLSAKLEIIDRRGVRPIALRGKQEGDGSFTGAMAVRSLLCPARYRLVASLNDGRRSRNYRYRFRVAWARYKGRAVPCPT